MLFLRLRPASQNSHFNFGAGAVAYRVIDGCAEGFGSRTADVPVELEGPAFVRAKRLPIMEKLHSLNGDIVGDVRLKLHFVIGGPTVDFARLYRIKRNGRRDIVYRHLYRIGFAGIVTALHFQSQTVKPV